MCHYRHSLCTHTNTRIQTIYSSHTRPPSVWIKWSFDLVCWIKSSLLNTPHWLHTSCSPPYFLWFDRASARVCLWILYWLFTLQNSQKINWFLKEALLVSSLNCILNGKWLTKPGLLSSCPVIWIKTSQCQMVGLVKGWFCIRLKTKC